MNRVVLASACIVLLCQAGIAQDTRSTLVGHVKDPQGAVIPRAAVTIVNRETNLTVRLDTDNSGYFEALLLPPDTYVVTIEAPGFKKLIRSGIELEASDRRDLEVALEVGATTESVTVTGEAPLIDVGRTDEGRVVDDRTVQDLPAMANTVFTMIQYSPGIQSGGPSILLGPHSTQGGSDYNNGNGVGGNAWTIDGAINDGNARYTANLPSVEMVSEAKIVNTTFDGSFGHSTGIGINVVTKSGSNDFHGSGTETFWNQRWQAASFFQKKNYYQTIDAANAAGNAALAQQDAAKPLQPPGHSNLFTANLTGPIRIPKVIDLRNKVFFSFNYQGERDRKSEDPSTYNHSVPTPAEKQGNFSDLLQVTANPSQYQLYDPLSTAANPNDPGHYIRTPIPGNVLPQQYIAMGSKVYNNYVKYWPNPNNWFNPAIAPSSNDFLSIDTPYDWTFNQYNGRMDINLTDKMRIFGRFTRNHFVEYRGDWTVDILPGLNNQNAAGSGVTRDDQNGVLDWVYSITPHTMAHASWSVSNWMSYSTVLNTPFQFKPSTMGLPSYLDDYCGNLCYMPLMNITGYSQNGISGTPQPIYNRFYGYNADLYQDHGHHSLRAGLDIRQQTRSQHPANNDGQYTFNDQYFQKCDDSCGPGQSYSPSNVGLGWAAFMMGLPSGITISNNDSFIVTDPYYAGFVQDTWRVTPKFTLTLSLRFEYETGATERYNRYINTFQPTAANPVTAAAGAAYAANPASQLPASAFQPTGAAIYAGTPGSNSRAWNNQLMWLPRIGYGYQINSKTVIRGGYGVYYDTNNVNAQAYGPNQQGYNLGTNTIVSTAGANNIPVFNPAWNVLGGVSPLTDPFPVQASGLRISQPYGNQLGSLALAGSSWTFPWEARHARNQRWRVSVERQVGSYDVVEASYEGQYASNININDNLSAVPSTYYNFGNTRSNTNPSLLSSSVANPFYGETSTGAVPANANAIYPSSLRSNTLLWNWMATQSIFTSPTRTLSQLIVQYPLTNITVGEPRGYSRSQMFDVSYTHRFHHGLTATFGYTAMSAHQATSYLQGWSPSDPTIPQAPYWVAGGASPNRVVASWVYDLPFGKNRAYVHNAVLSQIVGGWTLAGNYLYQPGNLLGFGNLFYYGNLSNIASSNPSLPEWFNAAGCVTSTPIDPGDTVAGSGACTSGFEKRSSFVPNSYQYRSMPQYVDGIRVAGVHQWSGSVSRTFQLHERLRIQTRLDMLNVLNHSILNGVDASTTSSTFGQVTSASAAPNRFIQIEGRVMW
jgi:hypothetical protein